MKGERLGLERMRSWKKREFEDFWEALRDVFRGRCGRWEGFRNFGWLLGVVVERKI